MSHYAPPKHRLFAFEARICYGVAPVNQVIEAADRAIAAEDFDVLVEFYADDAAFVVKPGLYARGKAEIRSAFVRSAQYFNHCIVVKTRQYACDRHGDTALVVSETLLGFVEKIGGARSRRTTSTSKAAPTR